MKNMLHDLAKTANWKLDDTRTDSNISNSGQKTKALLHVLGSKARHAHFRSAPEGQSGVLSEGAKIECRRLEGSVTSFPNTSALTNAPCATWQGARILHRNKTYAALGSSLMPPNTGEAKRHKYCRAAELQLWKTFHS